MPKITSTSTFWAENTPVATIIATIITLAITTACASIETGENAAPPSQPPSDDSGSIIGRWAGDCTGGKNFEFRNDGTLVIDGNEVRWFKRDNTTMVVTSSDNTTHVMDFRVEGDRLVLTGDLLSSCTLTRGAIEDADKPSPPPEPPEEEPAPEPCPSAIAAELPPGSGPGSTLIAAYISVDFEITLCSTSTGQPYYHGASRESGETITLPAQYEDGDYTARNGSYLYRVRGERIVVTRYGNVIVDQPLEQTS